MEKLTGPIIGLHFIKHNSVVIHTTHGLIHFPHLTMQVKSALSQRSAIPQPVLIHDSITIPEMTKKQSQHLLTTYQNGIEQGQ